MAQVGEADSRRHIVKSIEPPCSTAWPLSPDIPAGEGGPPAGNGGVAPDAEGQPARASRAAGISGVVAALVIGGRPAVLELAACIACKVDEATAANIAGIKLCAFVPYFFTAGL